MTLIALIVALGLGIRLLSVPAVVLEDGLYPLGCDPYYHLRRVERIVRNFPRIESYDPYLNFPEGARSFWRPGFDLGLATLGFIAGGHSASRETLAFLSSAVIPLLGAVSIALGWYLARLLYGEVEGLQSAFISALIPAVVFVTSFGRVDHHALEVAVYPVGFLILFYALRRESVRLGLLWGLIAGISLLFWNGAEIYPLIVASYAVLLALLTRYAKLLRLIALGQAVVLLITVIGVLLLWDKQLPLLSYSYLSPLQLSLQFGALGLLLFLMGFMAGGRWRWTALGACGVGLLLLFIAPNLRNTLIDALLYLARRKDPIVSLADESKPLLSGGIATLSNYISWVWVVVPVWLALLFVRVAKARRPEHILLLWWLITTGTMALLQRRFSAVFCIPLALLVGEGWRSWRWTVVLGLILLLLPIERFRIQRTPAGTPTMLYLRSTLLWMRENLPPAGEPPRYAVMAPWSAGHWMTYIAGKPNIVNPFGQAPQHILGARRARDFFLSESEQEAVRVLKESKAKYVLIFPTIHYIAPLLKQAGKNPSDYFIRTKGMIKLKERFWKLMAVRLLWRDETFYHLKLLYESPEKVTLLEKTIPFARVYEVVYGQN